MWKVGLPELSQSALKSCEKIFTLQLYAVFLTVNKKLLNVSVLIPKQNVFKIYFLGYMYGIHVFLIKRS